MLTSAGASVGLIGVNDSGKFTRFCLIHGIVPPDEARATGADRRVMFANIMFICISIPKHEVYQSTG